MRCRFTALFTLATALLALPAFAAQEDIQVPYKRYVLDNGLRLVVHEDHKAPIVAVNVWYHVGSKDEQRGKTGFAHLFEHLMFNGSEHHNDEYFGPFERVGATDMNGTTNNDRTNYFQNVPSNALDLALWMESDRMGHLLGAIDQAKLDEQRGVVQNEKRQRENQPFGKMFERIATRTFPPEHPYSWTTIGSMEDLNAASLQDVQTWFKTYYGAANAVLVVAGDVQAEDVRQRVQKHFGSIPPGPPLAKAERWVPRLNGEQRDVVQERAPNARLYMVWNTPPVGSDEAATQEVLADVLAGDDSSLLNTRLIRERQLASAVQAMYYDREISGQFWIMVDAARPDALPAIEQEVRGILTEIGKRGPSDALLAKAKARQRAGFVRAIERIGGFGGKADLLAQGEVYFGDPGHYRQVLARMDAVDSAALRGLVNRWLDDNVYVAEVLPRADFKATGTDVDRSRLPDASDSPVLALPPVQRATLPNGLSLVLMERHGVPLVEMSLRLQGGIAHEPRDRLGMTNVALAMLSEGAGSLDADEIAERQTLLGAEITGDATLDSTRVQLSALREQLAPSMALYAQLVREPTFPAKQLDTLKMRWINLVEQEKAQPDGLATRLMGRVLFGEQHPYAVPLTGNGDTASIQAIDREALARFHAERFRPDQATLVVAGDVNMETLKQLAGEHFGDWQAPASPSVSVSTPPAATGGTKIYLVDQPGSEQSTLVAGRMLPEMDLPQRLALTLTNDVFGGIFTSRLNMNLREQKHWSYGARSRVMETRGTDMLYAMTSVQADKTAPALVEIRRELGDIASSRGPSGNERDKVLTSRVLKLPGQFETLGALLGALDDSTYLGRPDDYLQRYPTLLKQTSLEDMTSSARQWLQPEPMTWLVIGDLKSIEAPIRALNWGEVQVLDKDGRVIR